MKIVEAISDTNIGGAGILLLTRLKHCDKRRLSYHVIIPKGSALRERLRELDVTAWEVDTGQDRSFSVSAVPQYVSFLRRIKPTLVNCHGNLSCRVAAWLCGIPCRVYTRHCAYPPPVWQTRFPGKWILGHAQTLLSSHILAVAEAAKENLTQTGVDPSRITVIINGTEPLSLLSEEERRERRIDLGIPEDAIVVGICARLEPCKGHRHFLEAAERLWKRSERYRFLIIGDGSLAKELKTWCFAHQMEHAVIFTGFVGDVAPYFNVMDINVNCSVGTETSSLALSEGMSLGIPAVVSDYGGNPYMVRHEENGLVYPQGRADLLAYSIARLAGDRALYERLSQNAKRRFIEELNAEQMTKSTEAFYRTILREKILE